MCDQMWDDMDAVVVCRQLGLVSAGPGKHAVMHAYKLSRSFGLGKCTWSIFVK